MKSKSSEIRRGGAAGERVTIVGGGIVGLAHAWSAAQRGCRVQIFERHPQAQGASIRNFGMVWPIGQPNGPNYRLAMRSCERWLELNAISPITVRQTGSLHLAYRRDELAVLTEFAELAPVLGYQCQLISPEQAAQLSPAVRGDRLLGALWSPTECSVDPRRVISEMPEWLAEQYGVELYYGLPVERIDSLGLYTSDGVFRQSDRTIVASGSDFQTLFPQAFQAAGLRLCKLQMLRTCSQPNQWALGPMLASGLTLRHYESFAVCKTLAALKRRIASETPELNQYGIHVMAAQNELGEVVLGDSHEYDSDISPFDKPLIDELILQELHKLIDLPVWTINERWHGIYPVLPRSLQFVETPVENVHIVVATGGCGMTMSFGLAEQFWEGKLGPRQTGLHASAVLSEPNIS